VLRHAVARVRRDDVRGDRPSEDLSERRERPRAGPFGQLAPPTPR
jgi:hypothetical protein